MKSDALGKNTSEVEVTNISQHGLWMLVKGCELFVPFKEFPWFKDASVSAILNVQLPSSHHLYWPDLDIDLGSNPSNTRSGSPLSRNELRKRTYHLI